MAKRTVGAVISKDLPVVKKGERGKMGKYDVLDVSKLSDRVIYRKLENLDPEISDTYHDPDKVWIEEFTDIPLSVKGLKNPRILVDDDNGVNPFGTSHGLIIRFVGTCAGERGMTEDGKIITLEEAEEMIEIAKNDKAVRMFNLWEFRIQSVIRTNGPELTLRSYKSEEERRHENESALVSSVEKAFLALADKMGNTGEGIAREPNGDDLVKALAGLDEVERAQLFQRVEVASDNASAEKTT